MSIHSSVAKVWNPDRQTDRQTGKVSFYEQESLSSSEKVLIPAPLKSGHQRLQDRKGHGRGHLIQWVFNYF